MTRSEAAKSTAAEQLVDIRDVRIDRSLPSEERIKSLPVQSRQHGCESVVCKYAEYDY